MSDEYQPEDVEGRTMRCGHTPEKCDCDLASNAAEDAMSDVPTNAPRSTSGDGLPPTELLPWQARVIAERAVLDSNVKKLRDFLSLPAAARSHVDAAEMERLTRQLRLMTGYSEVLTERIKAFNVR